MPCSGLRLYLARIIAKLRGQSGGLFPAGFRRSTLASQRLLAQKSEIAQVSDLMSAVTTDTNALQPRQLEQTQPSLSLVVRGP